MITNEKIVEFTKLLNTSERIALSAHVNPDGDAMGSMLGLFLFLKKMKKEVYIIRNSDFPNYLNFLPGKDFYNDNYQKFKSNDFDLFIALDLSTLDRLKNASKYFLDAQKKIVIDHHMQNTLDADLHVVNENASSTCQLVYELLESTDIPLDNDIATCLFTGIVTDTGRFMYDNTDSETLKIASSLMELEADFKDVYRNLYQSRTKNELLFESYIISKAVYYENDSICFVSISKDDADKFSIDIRDTDSIVNLLRDIETVKLSIVLKEYENNEYKVSLRSKDDIDVSMIARKNGGGGHKKAAGFSFHSENMNSAREYLIKTLGLSDD